MQQQAPHAVYPAVEPVHKETHTMALMQDKAKLAVAAVKGEDTQVSNLFCSYAA